MTELIVRNVHKYLGGLHILQGDRYHRYRYPDDPLAHALPPRLGFVIPSLPGRA